MDKLKKPNRLMRTVLVISLALNVAVVGAVAGVVVSGRAKDGPPQRIMFDFGPLARVLEPADRRAIGDAMRSNGGSPPSRSENQARLTALAMALRNEPFDAALVSETLGTFRQRAEQVQQDAQDAFVAHLATMSPEARLQLADRLEKGARLKH